MIGIFNTTNVGFGRANNQAFAKAKGRYILLFNPDAEMVEQDFLQRLFVFMENNFKYGLVSAKVLDASGEKETKPKNIIRVKNKRACRINICRVNLLGCWARA